MHPIEDDQQFVIDLLRDKKILVTHGTGFNWFEPDHFRLVTLPDVEVLTEAIGRIADFLETRAPVTPAAATPASSRSSPPAACSAPSAGMPPGWRCRTRPAPSRGRPSSST